MEGEEKGDEKAKMKKKQNGFAPDRIENDWLSNLM
jgi:hypothetical protein